MAISTEVASPAHVGTASAAAAGLETTLAGASGRTGSSALTSLSATSNRGERRFSLARPRSPLASSLRTLLLRGRLGVEVSVSPDATAVGGCVSRSTQNGRPTKKAPHNRADQNCDAQKR
jgi:hypothetical protein